MRATIRSSSVAVGLAALLATPAVASAQTVYGVAGGVDGSHRGLGYFTVQGSIGRRISPRFEARVDAFVSHWDEVLSGPIFVYCGYVPPGSCCSRCPGHYPAGVAGLVGNVVLYMAPPLHGPRAYLIGGVGAYCLGGDDHSMVGTYCFSSEGVYGGFLPHMRMGLSAGVGGSLPIGAQTRVVLEARYHFLFPLNRTSEFASTRLIPVTLGVRF